MCVNSYVCAHAARMSFRRREANACTKHEFLFGMCPLADVFGVQDCEACTYVHDTNLAACGYGFQSWQMCAFIHVCKHTIKASYIYIHAYTYINMYVDIVHIIHAELQRSDIKNCIQTYIHTYRPYKSYIYMRVLRHVHGKFSGTWRM
jgi:hypothetical protein